MNGNKLGAILLVLMFVMVSGTVFAGGITHLNAENEFEVYNSHLNGMAFMHNSIMETDFSFDDMIEVHETTGCLIGN